MTIQFEIENKTYTIRRPTVEDYYVIRQEITLNQSPGLFLVSLLSECPEEILRQLTQEQFDSLWTEFQKFYQAENAQESVAPPILTVGGKTFALQNLQDLRIGEFADLDIIVNAQNSESRIHEILAILYHEVIAWTDSNKPLTEVDPFGTRQERAEFLKQTPIYHARGIVNFFLLSAQESIEHTLDSLIQGESKKTNPVLFELHGMLKQLREPGFPFCSYWQEVTSSTSTGRENSNSTVLLTF
jgi:hypothetical protein